MVDFAGAIDFMRSIMTYKVMIVSLIASEIALHFYKRKKINFKEHFVNLTIFAGGVLIFKSVLVFAWFPALLFLQNLSPFRLSTNLNTYVFSLLLTDLVFYLAHRFQHRNGLLWSMHQVHHSSPDFSYSTGVRLPWLGTFFIWAFYAPIALLGFHPAIILFNRNLILFFQFFLHCRTDKKDSWLGLIFCTSSTHQVHHFKAQSAHGANFGGIFSFWDRIFGTYKDNCGFESQEFGISGQRELHDPISVNFLPLWVYLRSKFRAGKMKNSLWSTSSGIVPRKIQG